MRKKICHKCGNIIRDKNHKCEVIGKRMTTRRETKDNDSNKVLKTYRWKKKREHILKRDGYHCVRCWIKYGKIVSYGLEVHHIRSRKRYPELTFDDNNLVCLCKDCNLYFLGVDELDFEYGTICKTDFVL